jgi:hypothetical protein
MKISICLIIISLFNACSHPHQIKRTYRRHTTTSTPVTPLTDTEVQKDALKYFGSMPIPFQSWLENAILLIILVLNPIVTTEVRVLD